MKCVTNSALELQPQHKMVAACWPWIQKEVPRACSSISLLAIATLILLFQLIQTLTNSRPTYGKRISTPLQLSKTWRWSQMQEPRRLPPTAENVTSLMIWIKSLTLWTNNSSSTLLMQLRRYRPSKTATISATRGWKKRPTTLAALSSRVLLPPFVVSPILMPLKHLHHQCAQLKIFPTVLS